MTKTPDRTERQPGAAARPVRGLISVACAVLVNVVLVVSRMTSFDFLGGEAKQLALFAATSLTGVALVVGMIAGGLALIAREPRELATAGLLTNLITALLLLVVSLKSWF